MSTNSAFVSATTSLTIDEYFLLFCSINGNTTRQALERMPFDVQRYGVDILCIQFGMNDCNYWETDRGLPRVSPDAYYSNLKEMVSRGFQFGARIVLLPTSHPTPHIIPNEQNLSYEQNRRKYSSIVREVVAETNAELVDIEKYFESKISQNVILTDLLMPDGIH
ncbi:SGNH/GDSL hydrolase family protein, partial [bacterium]|nr:SGNH/GDSL hydrolase family protein [bacterium]